MTLDQKKQLLEDTTKKLLDKMGFKASVYTASAASSSELEKDENSPISIEIELQDSKFLIGKHGVNLIAFQHILRIIIRKESQEKINFNVDVNGYREEQKKAIVELAKESAEKVIENQEPIMLKPMNPFERRIVHMTLEGNNYVETESFGENEERKILIKPL